MHLRSARMIIFVRKLLFNSRFGEGEAESSQRNRRVADNVSTAGMVSADIERRTQ